MDVCEWVGGVFEVLFLPLAPALFSLQGKWERQVASEQL